MSAVTPQSLASCLHTLGHQGVLEHKGAGTVLGPGVKAGVSETKQHSPCLLGPAVCNGGHTLRLHHTL